MAFSNDQLQQQIESGDFAGVRQSLMKRPASDVASVLTALSPERQAVVFRLLPRRLAAATFEYLSRPESAGAPQGDGTARGRQRAECHG